MTKLAKGRYQVELGALTTAVSAASDKVFVDKTDRQRLYNRVMAEVDKTLSILPVENDLPFVEPEEVSILDASRREVITSCLDRLKTVRGFKMVKVEAELFFQAWEKAHVRLECADLTWDGWTDVFTRLIKFADEHCDGNAVFVMSVALQQWQARMEGFGISNVQLGALPFLQFHVEVKAGQSEQIQKVLAEAGVSCLMNHLNDLGANHDRDRYLLTVTTDVPAQRIHRLLKIDAVSRVTGGKLQYDT